MSIHEPVPMGDNYGNLWIECSCRKWTNEPSHDDFENDHEGEPYSGHLKAVGLLSTATLDSIIRHPKTPEWIVAAAIDLRDWLADEPA